MPMLQSLRRAALPLGLAVACAASAAWGQTAPPPAPLVAPAQAQVQPQPSAQAPAQPPAAAATPAAPAPAPPKPSLPPDVAQSMTKLTSAIETAEGRIHHLSQFEDELGQLRTDVEGILDQSTQVADKLRPRLADVKAQIDKLGPPPAKDAPPEAPPIAAERARLTALASAFDGAIKTTQLTWERARQLIEKITELRHSLFAKNLLERLPSPLLPNLWRDVAQKAPPVGRRIAYFAGDWREHAEARLPDLMVLLGATALLFLISTYVVARLTRRRTTEPVPTFFERATSVAWVAPLRALPAAGSALLLTAGLETLGLLYPPWDRTSVAITRSVVVFAAVAALAFTVLAPGARQWRLVNVADRPARRIGWLLLGIAALYSADLALTSLNRVFYIPLSLSVVQAFIASMLFALLLIGLLLTPFQPAVPASRIAMPHVARWVMNLALPDVARNEPRWLKLPLWIIALAIVLTALLGYVALARFIAQQAVLTGIVVVVGWLGYAAIRAVTRPEPERPIAVGRILTTQFGLDDTRSRQLSRLIEIALTLALVICAIPLLMLQWGFSGADIRDWLKSLLFGMEIGQFRISLARILLGIVLFIALLFATRLVQRWLREKALQQPRMDPGIVNSIDTVVGYAGTAIAALLAVSYAGFDITSLAIVAGALSVGIGFGLQSIVNNFVSGLILLIERPIKVGDRVVLGDQQGTVRRISVRATEIETGDRASLFVPNSELITGRVINWTHRDSLGAASVKVGVAYDADPEQVIAILRKCADEHPQVLRTPEPAAMFDDFGASALQFTLRVCLPDVGKAGAVQSELRIAILKALRAAGIDIPFDQLDVNLRDGAVERLLARVEGGHGRPADARPHATGNGGKGASGDDR
jgi:small-conductance mechanosensitive channel